MSTPFTLSEEEDFLEDFVDAEDLELQTRTKSLILRLFLHDVQVDINLALVLDSSICDTDFACSHDHLDK